MCSNFISDGNMGYIKKLCNTKLERKLGTVASKNKRFWGSQGAAAFNFSVRGSVEFLGFFRCGIVLEMVKFHDTYVVLEDAQTVRRESMCSHFQQKVLWFEGVILTSS